MLDNSGAIANPKCVLPSVFSIPFVSIVAVVVCLLYAVRSRLSSFHLMHRFT